MYYIFYILPRIQASSGKKGTYLSWNSALENRRLKSARYRFLLCKEMILTPAVGRACSYGSVWVFPPLCDARARIGNIPSLQCYISYHHHHHHHHVILSSLLLSSSHRQRFHKKKENIYLDSWHTHTHTYTHGGGGDNGRPGRTTQKVLDSTRRYWNCKVRDDEIGET